MLDPLREHIGNGPCIALATIFLLAVFPPTLSAQWSCSIQCGWLDNVSTEWRPWESILLETKPFSLWENGWEAGGSVEYRSKSWLSAGGACSYQSFNARPSGRYEAFATEINWSGESSWHVPLEIYARFIRPKAIMGTNLRIGLGVAASHVGKFTVTSAIGDYAEPVPVTKIYEGTGKTVYRAFGQITAGIIIPLSVRTGLALDCGYFSTFDRMVCELPLRLGYVIKW